MTSLRSPLGYCLVESLLHEWHQSAFLGQHSHQLDYEWQVVVTATRILDTVPANRVGKRLARESTNVVTHILGSYFQDKLTRICC